MNKLSRFAFFPTTSALTSNMIRACSVGNEKLVSIISASGSEPVYMKIIFSFSFDWHQIMLYMSSHCSSRSPNWLQGIYKPEE